jgi:ribosomal protein S18 acetylase RimI-like enzyme
MTTDTILTNATDEELGFAVFDNLHDLFRAMARTLPESEIKEGEKVSCHLTFPTNPMFKGVWKTRLTINEADKVIDQTIAWFKERNAPFFFWWTGGDTTPADLEERLARRGMISMEEQTHEFAKGVISTQRGSPCMVADLERMNKSVLNQTPESFVIKEVANEAMLYDFKKVFVETYEIPEWAGQAWVDATLKAGIGKTAWKMYVGYLDDEAVATNMLFNGGGVASVYAVAAIPAVRGKGIGGAITLKPLIEARNDGYKYAVLFATEMGIGAYKRIGFRMTETRINRYLWRNG